MRSLLLTLLACLFLSGCAGLSFKIDKDKTSKVRKVAILAIEIQQQQPKDALGFAKASELKEGAQSDSPEFQTMAQNSYNIVVQNLAQQTKWQVTPLEKLRANADYKNRVEEAMTGVRMTSMNSDADIVALKGTLDSMAFRRTSAAEKAKIAKSLGVDAIAEVVLIQTIDQGYSFGNLTGDAPFAFTTRANMQVYDSHGGEEPIWRIQNVDGELSPNSSSLRGQLSKKQKLALIGEKSSSSAISKMVESYNK